MSRRAAEYRARRPDAPPARDGSLRSAHRRRGPSGRVASRRRRDRDVPRVRLGRERRRRARGDAGPRRPRGRPKADFLSRADVDRILSAPGGISHGGPARRRAPPHGPLGREDAARRAPPRARGARRPYAFLTDHARDCAVAGGLFPADFRAQRREVDALNARAGDVRDVRRAPRRTSPRTARSTSRRARARARRGRRVRPHGPPRARATRRRASCAPLETPGVAVLGHPKGRLYDMRSGVRADWPRVFAPPPERGVAIELNGCPERLDLPPALARLAARGRLPLLDLERRARGRAPARSSTTASPSRASPACRPTAS